jgi:hypothetical protein
VIHATLEKLRFSPPYLSRKKGQFADTGVIISPIHQSTSQITRCILLLLLLLFVADYNKPLPTPYISPTQSLGYEANARFGLAENGPIFIIVQALFASFFQQQSFLFIVVLQPTSYHHTHQSTNGRKSMIDPVLRTIIIAAFAAFHAFAPKDWQLETVAHILKIVSHAPPGPIPILLCRPTGGGKSAIRDCAGLILGGGVVVTFVPLLAVAGDQTAKVRKASEREDNIRVFNLDEYRNYRKKKQLQKALVDDLDITTGVTVYLFSSPQTITTDTTWQRTLNYLIENGTIKLLTVDECHLFASFGLEFRKEFLDLDHTLFSKLHRSPHALPVLFMTATGTKQMVDELEKLTSLQFRKPENILWPSRPAEFSRRNVSLELKFNDTSVSDVKSYIRTLNDPALANNQFILYSNSVKRCTHLLHQSKSLLDSEIIPGDVVTVNGSLFKEQKFHHTDIFVGDDLTESVTDANGSTEILKFFPRGLFATAAGNAGLDSKRVRGIFRDGFPPALADLIQELGRGGRYPGATWKENFFRMILSLSTFYSLMFRIFVMPIVEAEQKESETAIVRSVAALAAVEARARATRASVIAPADNSDEEDEDDMEMDECAVENQNVDTTTTATTATVPTTATATTTPDATTTAPVPATNGALLTGSDLSIRQFGNLKEVLQVICLHTDICVHQKIEQRVVNPYTNSLDPMNRATYDPSLRCGEACWVCRNDTLQPAAAAMKLSISKAGLRSCLVDIFFHRRTPPGLLLLRGTVLANTLSTYKNSDGISFQKLVFDREAVSTTSNECKALILRLFAAGIFIPALDGRVLYCELAIDAAANPFLNSEVAFNGIALLD